MATRIGPRMRDALEYIRNHPGTAILPVAEYVGPNGSRQFGYRTVHRLINAGLVVNVSTRPQTYKLVATPTIDIIG